MIEQLLRLVSLHLVPQTGEINPVGRRLSISFFVFSMRKFCSWNFSFGVSYFESIVYITKRFNSHAVQLFQLLLDQISVYRSRIQLIRSLLCSIALAHFWFLRSCLSSVLRYTYTHLLSVFNLYFSWFECNTVWCTRWRILEAVRSLYFIFPFIELVSIGCRFTNTFFIHQPLEEVLNPAALNRTSVINLNPHWNSEKSEQNDSQ